MRVRNLVTLFLAGTMLFSTGSVKVSNTDYTVGGGIHAYANDETAASKTWVKKSGNWYYQIDGKNQTGWVYDSGSWYYLKSDGVMATGWVKLGSVWYFLYGNGAMATGWTKLGGVWYYMYDNGAMATGWVKSGNSWYYLYDNGVMATGWVHVGGVWYYMYGNGEMATNHWVGNYYLQADGSMATNKWIGQWYVGSDGLWVPGKTNPAHTHTWKAEATQTWVPNIVTKTRTVVDQEETTTYEFSHYHCVFYYDGYETDSLDDADDHSLYLAELSFTTPDVITNYYYYAVYNTVTVPAVTHEETYQVDEGYYEKTATGRIICTSCGAVK